jgi:hypothetical protein
VSSPKLRKEFGDYIIVECYIVMLRWLGTGLWFGSKIKKNVTILTDNFRHKYISLFGLHKGIQTNLKPVTEEHVSYDKFLYGKLYLPSARVYVQQISMTNSIWFSDRHTIAIITHYDTRSLTNRMSVDMNMIKKTRSLKSVVIYS